MPNTSTVSCLLLKVGSFAIFVAFVLPYLLISSTDKRDEAIRLPEVASGRLDRSQFN